MNSGRKNKILLLVVSILITTSFIIAPTVLAVDTGLSVLSGSGLGTLDLRTIIMSIVNVVLGFLAILAILIMLYGGFIWMTSGGDDTKVLTAKKILVNGTIGLVIILLSFALTTFILSQLLIATGALDPCEFGVDTVRDCPRNPTCLDQQCESDDFWGDCYDKPSLPAECESVGPSCQATDLWPDASVVLTINNVIPQLAVNNRVDLSTLTLGNYSITVVGGLASGLGCASDNQCLSDRCIDTDSDDIPDTCDGAVVDGSFNPVSRERIIEFIPTKTCASSCGDKPCFSIDTEFSINIGSGIYCQNEVGLACGAFCATTFTTGDQIDCEAPQVLDVGVIDQATGLQVSQVCQDTYDLQAEVSDDAGIRYVNFTDNDSYSVTVSDGWPAGTFIIDEDAVGWNTSDYNVGEVATMTVFAQDYDQNSGTRQENYTIRAAHCCNLTWDDVEGDPILDGGPPEEGPNCGGECGACDGSACDITDEEPIDLCQPDDNLCSSVFCEDTACICLSPPIIDYVSPARDMGTDDFDDDEPYGPPGSMVTIFGRHFGTYVAGSTVEFTCTGSGADLCIGGWVQARLAGDVNGYCDEVDWLDDQIIAVVPYAIYDLVDGSVIRVTEGSSGLQDETNDLAIGERQIENFDPTGNPRPGLCAFTNQVGTQTEEGIFEELINYHGLGLSNFDSSNDFVYFGSVEAYLLNVSAVTNLNIDDIGISNVEPGRTQTYIEIDSESGNALNFRVLSTETYPIIYDFSPTNGAEGTYVTITGDNFGDNQGSGEVNFISLDDGSVHPSHFDFPDECTGNYWSNTQIIAKVPDEEPIDLTEGDYIIEVVNNGGNAGNSEANFTVNTDVHPSICLVQPSRGPAGVTTNIYGEFFTDVEEVFFQQQVPVGGIVPVINPAPEDADIIGPMSVPTQAITGSIFAKEPGVCSGPPLGVVCYYDNQCPSPQTCNHEDSNPYNFVVGDCTAGDFSCTGAEECCVIGQYRGACMPLDQCIGRPKTSFYMWQFSTGTDGPRVVEECNRSDQCDLGYCDGYPTTSCHDDGDCLADITCLSAFSSPTPLSPRDDLPPGIAVNSIVSARFDQDMREATLVAPNNITVEKCEDFTCAAGDGSPLAGTIEVYSWAWDGDDAEFFNFYPAANFDPDTWYIVTLNNSIQNYFGLELANGYSWTFRTRVSTEPADVGCLDCAPSDYTLVYAGEDEPYTSLAYAQNNECVILDSSAYDWNWTTDPDDTDPVQYATIAGYCEDVPTEICDTTGLCAQDSCCTVAEGDCQNPTITNDDQNLIALEQSIFETPDHTKIDAEILTFDTPPGQCILYTDFTTPVVIDKWPECNTACVNAEIGAAFNRELDDSATSISASTVLLYICWGDRDCDLAIADNIEINGPTYSPPDISPSGFAEINLTPLTEMLVPGAYYRVVLCSDILSDEGVNLGNLNLDSGTVCSAPGADSYSWKFRVMENLSLCEIDRIAVSPVEITKETSQTQLYKSTPYSKPDRCQPEYGQRLNPYTYDWDWTSTNPQGPTADLIRNTAGDLRDVCGNRVIERGESCDDGNVVSGDGCTGVDSAEVDVMCSGLDISSCNDNLLCLWNAGNCDSCEDFNTEATCTNSGSDLYPKCFWNTFADPDECQLKSCVFEGNRFSCGESGNLAPNPGFEEIIAGCTPDGANGICPLPCTTAQDPDCP